MRPARPRRSFQLADTEFRRLYLQRGFGLRQLAERFSVSPQGVSGWLEAAGVPRRAPAPPTPPASSDAMAALYHRGCSGPHIAARFGCLTATVYRRLEAAGVSRPRPSPAVDRASRVVALDAGEIHRDQDRREEAEQAFDAPLALAGTDDERARAWGAQGSLAYRVGDFEGAVGAYEKRVASLLEPSPLVRARLEAEMGWAYSRMGRIDDALALLRPATAVLAQLGDGSTAGHALDQLATVLGVAGQAEKGLEAMQRALAALGPTGDERLLGILTSIAPPSMVSWSGSARRRPPVRADCADRYRPVGYPLDGVGHPRTPR